MPRHALVRTLEFDVNQAFPNDPDNDGQNNNSDRFPTAITLANGGFLVVWRSPANADLDPDRPFGTAFQRFNADGSIDGAAQRFDGLFLTAATPIADGFVLAGRDQWLRFDLDGNQIGSGVVGTDPTRANAGHDVHIETLADGGWVVVWSRAVSQDFDDVFAQEFSPSGAAGPVEQVNAAPVENLTDRLVSALAGGGAAIGWLEGPWGSERTLQLSLDGDFTPPIVQSELIGNAEMALLPDGRLLVVWGEEKADAPDVDLFAAFVEADGTVSDPFLVNVVRQAGDQLSPQIAVFPDGRFVIAWALGAESFIRIETQVFAADGSALGGAGFTGIEGPAAPSEFDYAITTIGDSQFMLSWAPFGSVDRTLNAALYTIDNAVDFVGTPADDSFTGTYLDDSAQGLGGADQLFGGNGDDQLNGGEGNDLIDGGNGADRMEGGSGNDVYYVSDAGDVIVEAVGGGNDAAYSYLTYTLTEGAEVETLSTISHAATDAVNLTGNLLNQTVIGNAGANILHGGGGTDQLVGLGGNDVYYVDVAATQVQENAGGGADTIYASVGYALGGAEVEILSTNDYAATTAINLTGNLYNQVLVGNAGANALHGGGGTDVLVGLGGNDVYYVDVAATQIVEAAGGGADTVYASISYALGADAEVETLSANDYGATTAINLTGNAFSQTLIGNAGNNVFHGGGGGVDAMIGLGGDDIYYVDVAGAQVSEAAGGGADTIYAGISFALAAGNEVERLSSNNYGATDAIGLTGNAFAQVLTGNAGANTLDGGAGADTLYGLGAADNFAFTTALGGGNVDTIADFSVADDTIQLDDAIFAAIGGPGSLNPNAFATGSAAGDADDRIIYNSATGQLFYDSDGNGAGAAVQFAALASGLTLTASDFQVI